MKLESTVHKIAAVVVFLVWVVMFGAMVFNREFWGAALPYILLVSVATIVGTVLLSRYWIRRNQAPSYGSIFVFPSICVFLLISIGLFVDACIHSNWDAFTLKYWTEAKGGVSTWLIPISSIWFVCLFPAAAVVIYFQKSHDSDLLEYSYDKSDFTRIYEEGKKLFLRGKFDQAKDRFKSIYEYDSSFRNVADIVEDYYGLPKDKWVEKYKTLFRRESIK